MPTLTRLLLMASLAWGALPRVVGRGVFRALPYVFQCLGLLMGAMMPCVRSTVASLAESGAMNTSVAVSLGSLAGLTTLFSIVAPVASPIYAATEDSTPELICECILYIVGHNLPTQLPATGLNPACLR